jgi:hypothetical protein
MAGVQCIILRGAGTSDAMPQRLQAAVRQPHMTCPGCHVGINIDTNRLAKAAAEIHKAIEKSPPEITIKFFAK